MNLLRAVGIAIVLGGCAGGDGFFPAGHFVGQDSSHAAVFARVGSVLWGSDQTPTDTIGVWDLAGFLRIQGTAKTAATTDYLTLDLGFSGRGPYPLHFPLASTAYYSEIPTSGLVDSIIAYQSTGGNFTIQSYDSLTKYIVGTFAFGATWTGGHTNVRQIDITNGTFRGFIRYR
jgi:hypothetical protein